MLCKHVPSRQDKQICRGGPSQVCQRLEICLHQYYILIAVSATTSNHYIKGIIVATVARSAVLVKSPTRQAVLILLTQRDISHLQACKT